MHPIWVMIQFDETNFFSSTIYIFFFFFLRDHISFEMSTRPLTFLDQKAYFEETRLPFKK